MRQRRGDFVGPGDSLRGSAASLPRNQAGQRFARYVLHAEKRPAVFEAANVKHFGNRRMIELPQGGELAEQVFGGLKTQMQSRLEK